MHYLNIILMTLFEQMAPLAEETEARMIDNQEDLIELCQLLNTQKVIAVDLEVS